MLFIQSLDTYYEKEGRSSEYARLRTGDIFKRIDLSKVKECELFAQFISMRYDNDGKITQAQPYSERYRQYGKSIFTEGTRDQYKNYNELLKFIRIFRDEDRYRIMFCDENVPWCPAKRRGHNEAFNDENSVFYRRDRLNETAFILNRNEYGRIIYNNRYVDVDTQQWYYGRHIYNIINCDISECQEKMFFEKEPDYEYRQLLDLR